MARPPDVGRIQGPDLAAPASTSTRRRSTSTGGTPSSSGHDPEPPRHSSPPDWFLASRKLSSVSRQPFRANSSKQGWRTARGPVLRTRSSSENAAGRREAFAWRRWRWGCHLAPARPGWTSGCGWGRSNLIGAIAAAGVMLRPRIHGGCGLAPAGPEPLDVAHGGRLGDDDRILALLLHRQRCGRKPCSTCDRVVLSSNDPQPHDQAQRGRSGGPGGLVSSHAIGP
jgi:hypothetical protein